MKKLLTIFSACAISCLLMTSTSISAATFTGYAYGEFSNPDVGSGDSVGINNHDLGWSGRASSSFRWGRSVNNSWRHPRGSLFKFDGAASDYFEDDFVVGENEIFSLGRFSYFNEPTTRADNVTGVDFGLNVNLNGIWSEFDFSIGIDNTPNGTSGEPDAVWVSHFADDVLFDYAGESYLFEMLGFRLDGENDFIDSLYAAESTHVHAQLYGRISAVSAVPVPAAVWLFASGLIALTGVSRAGRRNGAFAR